MFRKFPGVRRSTASPTAAILLLFVMAPTAHGQNGQQEPTTRPTRPEPGISLELARERHGLLQNVRYQLDFELSDGMAEVRGEALVHFSLTALPERGLGLDFGGAWFRGLTINGARHGVQKVHDHIVLPAAGLQKGDNVVRMLFASKVAATGTPLTVYTDKTDGKNYYYTLVVPADAHRLFPCFDQPDLKARFDLTLRCPSIWQVTANGLRTENKVTAQTSVHRFATTKPLSTYLFAFAAGPFACITDSSTSRIAGNQPMRILCRQSKLESLHAPLLFEMHRRAANWLGDYFAHPYPFGKLDFVLCPGFPYGGMEHAGAIFYRESSLVFDHEPNESELTRRSTLIYHEVSHQWFGNLVTMRWFDDLWLKEGFATFMGYTLLENLEPGKQAWLRFHQRVKPRAYRIDATKGTTPVYQELANLADAKSAYGAIVYNKAPAVIRELNARLGAANFQAGLQAFVRRHAFANATWEDLVAALEVASKQSAALWSQRWILAPGMPCVLVQWSSKGDTIDKVVVRQRSTSPDTAVGNDPDRDQVWPLRLELLSLFADGRTACVNVTLDGAATEIAELAGKPAPAAFLLNPKDVAYGRFLLDGRSRDWLLTNIARLPTGIVRACALSALWETVREAELDPERFHATAIRLLQDERDPENHAWLLDVLGTSTLRYSSGDRRKRMLAALREIVADQLRDPGRARLALQCFRFLVTHCSDADTLAVCESAVARKEPLPGLVLGWPDRFLAAAALLAAGRDQSGLEQLRKQAHSEDVAKHLFVAGAAAPTRDNKKDYFAAYLNLDTPPEQWTEASLTFFHWPGQEELTLPYLRQALERIEWVKSHRKIFFAPAWIDAFVNGHSERAALDLVQQFLKERADLPVDLQRKLLQSLDDLERTVRIRERYR